MRRDIGAPVAEFGAVLQRSLHSPERSALNLLLEPLISEAVLHLQVDRAAQRIEAEDRVAGGEISALDRIGRDQVPVDGVAEGFVDADSVHVNRKALRRALQR